MNTKFDEETIADTRCDERAMREVLIQLELVSHGRTMRVDGRVTGSKDPSAILRRDEEPYPHEHFRQRWNETSDVEARRQVLAEARACLEGIRKTPPPPEPLLEPGSFAWKLHIAKQTDTPVAELVRIHGCSRSSIRRWREMYLGEDLAERDAKRLVGVE